MVASERAIKWAYCNRRLNLLRKAKGDKLVDSTENPYGYTKELDEMLEPKENKRK